MMRIKQLIQVGLLALALAPVLMFAYMGQHTRLIHDDFGYTAAGRELGAWDTMIHYYNRWSPAYTTVYIKAALSSLGELLPPLSTLLIVSLWMLGFYLLMREAIALLGLEGPRRLIALSGAALLAAAAINAFYSPQSFYWFSSNMTYTLPLGALAGCLALGICILKRSANSTILYMGAAVCALIMFLTAGAAEMYVVFQFVFLAALAALAIAVADKQKRRALAIIAAAMLLATALGLIIQVTSPGVANRLAADAERYRPPVKSLSLLATLTIQLTLESIGRPDSFAGFVLLLAAGLFTALATSKPAATSTTELSGGRLAVALSLGLAAQLVFLPIMLAHKSDNAQLLGRYSLSYLMVLALHIFLLLAFAAARWQRRRLQRLLERRRHGLPIVSAVILLAFILLFALTQVRRIDSRASTFLFVSALSLLAVLALLWQSGAADRRSNMLGAVALASLPIAWLTIAAQYCVTFIGHGFTADRIMSGSAWLQVLSGLVWGLYLGYLVKSSAFADDNPLIWKRWLAIGSLTVAVVVGGGIFLGQAKLLPKLRIYAAEWDARHAYIIGQRQSGRAHIRVEPLSFDLADYLGLGTLRSAEQFYGVDTIVQVSQAENDNPQGASGS